jgi:crotonobetainyl-CoA:carnitine CoA-transferase CaiB-like acyl-CoA transferase
MLTPYRVLDLTDEKGFLCGKILADLGADVIKIEPPGGDPARNQGPYYHNTPVPEKSLFWFSYNVGKRGITLNLKTNEGANLLKRLAKTADFIIESFPPGHMESLGLGYPVLQEINPGLVFTSISSFGQTGPYKDYKAPDIVGMAMGGFIYHTGDMDRPPLRISFPQAYLMASVRGAEASLIALWHRQRSGNGQWVDVSMQECVVSSLIYTIPSFDVIGAVPRRLGQYITSAAVRPIQRIIWPCKDGAVVAFIMTAGMAPGAAKSNRALAEWIESDGMADDFLRGIDWDTYDWTRVAPDFHNRLDAVVGRFFKNHTKAELYEEAAKRGVMLQTVSLLRDIVESPQRAAREFWVNIEHPELGTTIPYPGAFIKASVAPCHIGPRPPLPGEHNGQILGDELGLSTQEMDSLKERGII